MSGVLWRVGLVDYLLDQRPRDGAATAGAWVSAEGMTFVQHEDCDIECQRCARYNSVHDHAAAR
jgi:hypothetical protein